MNNLIRLFYRYILVDGAKLQFLLAGILIVSQIIVIIVDSAGSIFGLRSPFHGGGNELVQLQMGLIASFTLAYTWVVAGHVRIELIVDKLRLRGRFLINLLSAGLGCAYCIMVAIGIYDEALDSQLFMARTDMLRISIAPVMYLFCLSFAHFALLLLFDFVKNLVSFISGKERMSYMSSLEMKHLD